MTLPFSQEQRAFAAEARRFLEERSPSESVRALMETEPGFDERTWKQVAEMGWTAMAIPEAYGGAGTFTELAVLLEEMGRVLLCAPFFSSLVLGAQAILNAATEAQKADLLPRIADGTARPTLALTEESGRWDRDAIACEAARTARGYVVSGRKTFVVDGHTATLLLVAARAGDEIALFAVDPLAEGVTRSPLATLDMTRKQAVVDLDRAKAVRLGDEGDAWPAVERTLDRAAAALSAEMVGGAQRCLDMAAEYANGRIQFGRPIGQFQAVKHKCANMLMQVESARSAAWYAAWAAADAPEELPVAAPMAKVYCAEAYVSCAFDNVQIHGGIGFTWEHDAHLYLRRAKSSEALLGSPTYHRELLAQRIGV